MTRTEIEEKVKAFLIDDLEIDEDKVFDDAKLKEDMGIDSLDFVRLIQGIEMLDKMHGCVVDESVADELYPDITVSKFVEVVNKNIRPRL